MSANKTDNDNQAGSSADWIKQMTDFWSPLINTWGAAMQQPAGSSTDPEQGSDDPWQTPIEMWQAMLGLGEFVSFAHSQEASKVVPELWTDFAQTCVRGFVRFQGQVRQWMEKKGGVFPMEDPETFKKEFLQDWTDAYKKEFQQYFKIPQIGMGRFYQERVLNAADKHNLFQAAFSKFLQQLYLPMEEAFQHLQKIISEHAKAEQLDEDPKNYYRMWIKILEERYMLLFKRSDFSEAVGHTLRALNEYSQAKQAVVNDILNQYAIPTHSDLDELYKEIYLLKKRMRRYEKQ